MLTPDTANLKLYNNIENTGSKSSIYNSRCTIKIIMIPILIQHALGNVYWLLL